MNRRTRTTRSYFVSLICGPVQVFHFDCGGIRHTVAWMEDFISLHHMSYSPLFEIGDGVFMNSDSFEKWDQVE